MTGAAALLLLASFGGVGLIWALPRTVAQTALAIYSLAIITVLSPETALWIGATTLATPALMRAGEASDKRGLVVSLWGAVLVALLLVLRELPGPFWIGGAYFTLRHLHVLIDWWMGVLPRPGLGDYLRYQLFLPTLIAGPIHRFQNFQRQIDRHRWDPAMMLQGMERIVIGAFQSVVLGNWLLDRAQAHVEDNIYGWPGFAYDWAMSALYWVELYLLFAGLSSIAIGLALMMGLKFEENFDAPWRSRNLIEFWTRWHITLSNWCRDYVFRPISALTRAPASGVFAAMLAMGLWHGTTAYWIGWGLWQGLGIVLTRAAFCLPLEAIPDPVRRLAGPLVVFAWLTLSGPVLNSLATVLGL